MSQVAFTVRMDAEIKRDFDELCKDFGMSSNTAFNVFARAVIKSQRIPFDVESEKMATLERGRRAFQSMNNQAIRNGLSEMTLDEINEEIRLARSERNTNVEGK